MMSKPNKELNAFIIVNFNEQIEEFSEEDRQNINLIILNDTSVDELIHILRNTKEKSIKYYYVMCMANSRICIHGMIILLEFMNENGFKWIINDEQIAMYKHELDRIPYRFLESDGEKIE